MHAISIVRFLVKGFKLHPVTAVAVCLSEIIAAK